MIQRGLEEIQVLEDIEAMEGGEWDFCGLAFLRFQNYIIQLNTKEPKFM